METLADWAGQNAWRPEDPTLWVAASWKSEWLACCLQESSERTPPGSLLTFAPFC